MSLFGVACSSSSATTPSGAADTGPSADTLAPAADTAAPKVADRGIVVDYGSGKGVAGATVAEGSATTLSDDKGGYSLTIPNDEPLTLVVSKPGYATTFIGEMIHGVDFDRSIGFASLEIWHIGQSLLDGIDTKLGIVNVIVRPTGACTSIEGGTLTVNSPSGTKTSYFVNKFPDSTRTTMRGSEEPAVTVYNVPPGSQLDVTIAHPTCKVVPFPVDVDGTKYTGKIHVEGGDTNSVAYYYLQ
ncbi:MAG: hypothetical protein NVSMB47_15250 [Polyangiales bacterium]